MPRSNQPVAVSAVIYDKRGRVLSVGQNSYVKTHPLQKKYAAECNESYKQFLHAEISAIVKCKDLSKAHRIFVSRWNRQGQPVLARPCKICETAIRAAGIREISHT